MFGSQDYTYGYLHGRNSVRPDFFQTFQTTKTINQLRRNNQELQDTVSSLLCDKQELTKAFLDIAEQYKNLENDIRSRKKAIDQILFFSRHFLLFKKEFTDSEYIEKEKCLTELQKLVWELRKFFMSF